MIFGVLGNHLQWINFLISCNERGSDGEVLICLREGPKKGGRKASSGMHD